MKNKILWGSVIVALLMLMGIQMVFLNIVRSDPNPHTGDADVGDLWIDELNVSSELTTYDFIGLGHANATDDWVIWEDGSGNINTSWSVNISTGIHPEYYVLFGIVIYNVDDNCNEVGNDTFTKTYTENLSYSENGTLSVDVEFTQDQQRAGAQTLVCYISAWIQINDTTEAKNFTCWAQDRSTLAVDFVTPQTEPDFSIYREEANDDFPNMWSWIDGWDEGGKFDNEDDMLENQTYFELSGNPTDESSYDWKIGELDITCKSYGRMLFDFTEMNQQPHMKFDLMGDLYVNSYATISYTVQGAFLPIVASRYVIIHEGQGSISSLRYATRVGIYDDDEIASRFMIDEDDDLGSDNKIDIWGYVWAARPLTVMFEELESGATGYQIQIDQGVGSTQSAGDIGGYFWKDSCAYFNETHSVSVTSTSSAGITTVDVDISNVLQCDDEFVYIFAGENGDTRIQISC